MAPRRRVLPAPVRVPLIALGGLLAAVGFFVAGSIAFFALGRHADVTAQERRVRALAAPGGTAAASLAVDLALPDTLPLDRIAMIATHNSYRERADALRLFFIGLAQPGEPALLDYGHRPLAEQLDSGLRSFELDVRLRTRGFITAHVPLVDNRSTAPDLALGLREIALWSDRNPGHAPVIVLFEVKDDYGFLDPSLRAIGAAELDRLDALVRAALGPKLLTPDDVRGSAPTLAAGLAARGWPRLRDVRGRVMVVLHEDEAYRLPYVTGHAGLQGRAMFTCAPEGAPDAGIAILNDPVAQGARIAALTAKGWLVRTRADADGAHSAAGLAAALSSGAQVISTDFPPLSPAKDGYTAAFPGGVLLQARTR